MSSQAITNGLGERVTLKQGKLVAVEAMPEGTFLAQYTGEVLTKEEMDSRLKSVYQGGQALFMLPIGSTAVVDATRKGSIARLGGHSCDPNAEVKPWLVEVSSALIRIPGNCLASLRSMELSSRPWPCTVSSSCQQGKLSPTTSRLRSSC